VQQKGLEGCDYLQALLLKRFTPVRWEFQPRFNYVNAGRGATQLGGTVRGWPDPCDRGFGPRHLQARPVLA